MHRILIGLGLALVALPAWAQTLEENRSNCSSKAPDLSISACTAYIQSGQQKDTGVLAKAYLNRGHSYLVKDLYDKAIPDLTIAIATLPGEASLFYDHFLTAQTYYFRGLAYEKKGERDNAMADYRAAQKLVPGNKDLEDAVKRLGTKR